MNLEVPSYLFVTFTGKMLERKNVAQCAKHLRLVNNVTQLFYSHYTCQLMLASTPS